MACSPCAAQPGQASADHAPRFVSAAAAAGLQHVYRDGPTPLAEGPNSPSSAGAFVVGGGVAALDCDGDDLLDLFLAGGAAPAALYRNETDLETSGVAPIAFVKVPDIAAALGVEEADARGVTGAYAFYWDADAEPDLFVMRFGRNLLLRGLGECRFEDVSAEANLPQAPDWTAAFAAYWPQGGDASAPVLAVGAYVDRERPLSRDGNCDQGYILAPQGAARYGAPLPIEPAGCALSMLFVDWAGDGGVALRVSNDRQYAPPGVGEQLFGVTVAEGAPTLELYGPEQGWEPTVIWGMGLAAADLDGDGAPEIAATSMADNRVERLIASAAGAPSYENIAPGLGALGSRPYVGPDVVLPSTSWHIEFADFNNDAALDMWVVKGNVADMAEFAMFDPDSLMLGAPSADGVVAPFREVGFEAGVALSGRGRGGAAVDLNNDGALDLVVVQFEGPTRLFQAIPAGSGAGAVSVALEQSGGNHGAVGSVVELETPDGRVQRRVLRVGGGHASGSAAPLHFGLGAAEAARLRVRWPDGATTPWRTVSAGDRLTIKR